MWIIAQQPAPDATGGIVLLVLMIAGGILGLMFYMLPTINAVVRGHPNTAAIVILNILAGWTFVGWIAAAVWSATAFDRRR